MHRPRTKHGTPVTRPSIDAWKRDFEGAGAGPAALIVMATLTLGLPDFTTTTQVGSY
jgi:hypothetical protein